MAPPSAWLAAWRGVHWGCLGAGAAAALFLLLHSATFHRLKRRMADLLLIGIALADLSFVALSALQQTQRSSYVARFRRQDEHEQARYSTGDFALALGARFGFFLSLYWIANLSLLVRLGNLEALHVRRSLLLSVLVSLVYGCMHAVLPTLDAADAGAAYTVTAVLLLVMQATPLLLIVANLRAVRRSRLNSSTQGRNVIRRLTGYCVCAAVLTMPYALVLVCSQGLVGVGAVAETLNYLLPVANALLFGTSLSCCCCCATAAEATLPKQEDKVPLDDTPSSSIDISAGALTDGSATPGSTGYTGVPTAGGGVLGMRDGLLAGGPIAEMVTEGPAVKIGEGSSAEVYKAQWLGITVALKCLRFHAGSSSEAELYMTHLAELRTEFLDEAVLAAQLRHPNITLFIKMGTYKGSLCLVNEYCARGSLRDVLRANPLMEWNTKVRLAFEAAKGLAFMHNREPIYLHRDLKASNILVTADWTAKIADFGIARIATDFTVKKQHISQKFSAQSFQSLQSIGESVVMMDDAASELMTTFAGTWRWNAPEIMKNPNECRFNRETDMYSFGVALWEILTNGAVPFGNVDFDHQVRQLVAAGERPALPPAYLRRAPPEFVEVMCACWHQRPEKRPSAQDVMLRLGSLSYTLSNGSEFYTSSQGTARYVFSDNYYQAMDSGQSCPGLW
ncbi:TKL/DRK protein kinase [Phytophthora cinnamomi]|uniref:TKL/DRK protein kinase n=1 Tax=Phytophthora cinnamomi TaxID=4785 RepID=UPI00355A6CCD|nr:TKL/DRK protein kinase [Phytophthora cinnamomi]